MADLDNKARPELARKIHFDEADIGAGDATRWSGVWFGHPGEDARSAAE